ncbi:MAG: hypothetical protein IIA54_07955, partial [Chloroflexi bacterium]|nr:hypothetical protein [Chloroflexota bacterium]
DWTMLRIPPMIPPSKEVAFVVIGLHLHPTEKSDIRGTATFDDIWLAHLPRMTVQINSAHNIFTENDKVTVTCQVSGILERDPVITFELVDISSHKVDENSKRLRGRVVQRKSSKASSLPGLHRNKTAGFAGETQWSPNISKPGFYRVQVTMKGRKKLDGQREALMQRRLVTFAIVHPEKPRPGGEFGWTLPSGDDKLSLAALDELLGHAAVSWVKFPVWYSHKDTERAARLGRFAERLAARGINVDELSTELTNAPMSGELLFKARVQLRLPADASIDDLRDTLEALRPPLPRPRPRA